MQTARKPAHNWGLERVQLHFASKSDPLSSKLHDVAALDDRCHHIETGLAAPEPIINKNDVILRTESQVHTHMQQNKLSTRSGRF